MVLRVLAWIGLLFGGVITAESMLLPPHRPNVVWLLFFVLGAGFFVKNGFLKAKPPSETPTT